MEEKSAGDPENALHLPLNTDLVLNTISRATGRRCAFLELSVVCVLSVFFAWKNCPVSFPANLNMAEMTHVCAQKKNGNGLWLGSFFESALLSGNI